jgi:hypothetical protein
MTSPSHLLPSHLETSLRWLTPGPSGPRAAQSGLSDVGGTGERAGAVLVDEGRGWPRRIVREYAATPDTGDDGIGDVGTVRKIVE